MKYIVKDVLVNNSRRQTADAKDDSNLWVVDSM